MRLHCGQKCSSTGAPAPQLRHSSIDGARTGMGSGLIGLIAAPGGLRAEGTAAAAGRLRVRVVEDETLRQERRVVVERRAVEEEQTLLIDEDLRAVGPFEDLVPEPRRGVPPECVAEAGAAAPLHADTKTALADALLGHQRPDLLRGGLAYLDHGRLWATGYGL